MHGAGGGVAIAGQPQMQIINGQLVVVEPDVPETTDFEIDEDPIQCQRNDVYQVKLGKLTLAVVVLGFIFIWVPLK